MVPCWRDCNYNLPCSYAASQPLPPPLLNQDSSCWCRCGHQFCYVCGMKWKTCNCPQWEEARLQSEAGTRVQGMMRRQGWQLTTEAFQEAVAQMAERLRTPQPCTGQGHAWRKLKGSINAPCSNCGFYLRHFCFMCENENCGACICIDCRFHRPLQI